MNINSTMAANQEKKVTTDLVWICILHGVKVENIEHFPMYSLQRYLRDYSLLQSFQTPLLFFSK